MKLPEIPRFSADEMIFSSKCFAAAMLAGYLASLAGQPRPFWALMTAYVVANPLAGMVRSKAMYRFCGTLLGSAAAVFLIPLLSNSPELLSLAMALWVGGCLYIALHDRTPRSYAFMLAGYTAALIGFPSVNAPQNIFDTASARVEEIGFGILAASLVHSIVFPTGLSKTVLSLLDRTVRDTRRWMRDLLQAGRSPQARQDRREVASDITQLRLLSIHIPYDTSHLRWTTDAVNGMQDGVAGMTPLLSAVEDRLQALEEAEDGLAPDVLALLAAVNHWLERTEDQPTALDEIRVQISAFADAAGRDSWRQALRIALATRLREMVDAWQGCLDLRRDIDQGLSGLPVKERPAKSQGQVLHLDQGMALLSALAAVVAILICCVFWFLTGWNMGSGAVTMAAIFSCLFASMDDPVPAINSFLKYTLWSIPIAAVYVLILLPLVQDFASLALLCAPTFLILGAYVGRPSTVGKAMPLLFGVCGVLAMHDTSQADMVSLINSMLGQVFGIAVAARTASLMRSVGAGWSARRIQHATWRDLDELASSPRMPENSGSYLLRMLDRIALLAPRVAQAGGSVPGVPVDEALRDLRIGADIVALQSVRGQLPSDALQEMLGAVALWFRQRIEGQLSEAPALLQAQIDRLLSGALDSPDTVSHTAVTALVGMRRNLFPGALPCLDPVQEGGAG